MAAKAIFEYALYNKFDDLLMVGTAREISEYIEATLSTVRAIILQTKQNPDRRGYRIIKIEGE